jgi:hypothetical protein
VIPFNRLSAALTALVLLTLGFGAVPAHAAGSADPDQSFSWTVRTALSQYGSDRPKFSYTVRPGQELTDGIVVANKGKTKISLKIYAADGFTTESGGYDVLTPDHPSKGVGTWVTPHVVRITVPAHDQVQIPFTIDVPRNATPGDHLGGIVTVLDQVDPSGSGNVIHRRVGLRIETRVSGPVTNELTVEKLKLAYDGVNPFGSGRATLSYTVHNTGNTVLGGLQKARVASGLGLSSRTVTLERLPSLLPGETWTARRTVPDVRALLWVKADVTVTPVVTDAAGSTSTLEPITASVRTVVSAWSYVIASGGLVALGLLIRLIVLVVRRRRRSNAAKVDAKVAAAVDEALTKQEIGK